MGPSVAARRSAENFSPALKKPLKDRMLYRWTKVQLPLLKQGLPPVGFFSQPVEPFKKARLCDSEVRLTGTRFEWGRVS